MAVANGLKIVAWLLTLEAGARLRMLMELIVADQMRIGFP